MAEHEPRYYMVRAMRQTQEDFDRFFGKSVVAIGWSSIDFTQFKTGSDLVEELNRTYNLDQTISPTTAGKCRSIVRRFKEIQAGDRIVVPYYRSIALALATETELYDETLNSPEIDQANQRRVTYKADTEGNPILIPRDSLSEGLQRRLRVPGSMVADLSEFQDELQPFFEATREDLVAQMIGWKAAFAKKESDIEKEFGQTLLQNIRKGNTNLKAGGLGLQDLVRELLEAEGYKAKVLSTNAFPGLADADIRASKSDTILGTLNVLVQVKHHEGISGTWGSEQLKLIPKLKDTKWADDLLVLVTTADASEDLAKECEYSNIRLLAGDDFIAWLVTLLPQLSQDTKQMLGISKIPTLLWK